MNTPGKPPLPIKKNNLIAKTPQATLALPKVQAEVLPRGPAAILIDRSRARDSRQEFNTPDRFAQLQRGKLINIVIFIIMIL